MANYVLLISRITQPCHNVVNILHATLPAFAIPCLMLEIPFSLPNTTSEAVLLIALCSFSAVQMNSPRSAKVTSDNINVENVT